MKRLIYTLILCLLPLSAATGASPKTRAGITNASITRSDDKVIVGFDISDYHIPSAYKVTLTPMLWQNGMSATLPPVTLTGRKMDMLDRRAGRNDGGQRLVVTRRTSQTIRYSIAVDYEEWMQSVSLSVGMTWGNCCDERVLAARMVLADVALAKTEPLVPHYDCTPLTYELTELEKYDLDNSFLHPMEDYAKRYGILRSERQWGASVVYFKAGSAEIDPYFRGNYEVLNAIARAFELIEKDPRATLKHIMVAGYASPEGSLQLNTALAQSRAEAVRQFVQTRMKKPSHDLFELYNGREDWEGLRNLVARSSMRDRQMVLNIIDSYTMEQEQRKFRLRRMSAGEPYEYMLNNFYPSLRNAGYVQVYYEIDRGAGVTMPYTDDNGRSTWVDSDSPANQTVRAINYALELMNDERYVDALAVLQSVSSDRRTYNCLGVCYMMTGDEQNAERFLRMAAQDGNADAAANLKQLGK